MKISIFSAVMLMFVANAEAASTTQVKIDALTRSYLNLTHQIYYATDAAFEAKKSAWMSDLKNIKLTEEDVTFLIKKFKIYMNDDGLEERSILEKVPAFWVALNLYSPEVLKKISYLNIVFDKNSTSDVVCTAFLHTMVCNLSALLSDRWRYSFYHYDWENKAADTWLGLGVQSVYVVAHELAHIVDDGLGKHTISDTQTVSDMEEYQKLISKQVTVSQYSLSNSAENFAENIVGYLTDPLYHCYSPDTFAFFSRLGIANSEVIDSHLANCEGIFAKIAMAKQNAFIRHYPEELAKKYNLKLTSSEGK
jgi:hypothetical protein